MKAPDKIYVPQYITFSRTIQELGKPIVPCTTEYISKGALLEWAKEKKKQLLENESANDKPSDVAAGINAGLDMLIGKLNSM